MKISREASDGSRAERANLAKRARAVGADLRGPFRLPHSRGQRPSEQVSFGRGAYLGPGSWLNLVGADARLVIGEGAFIGDSLTVSCGELVEVGEHTLLSARVTLLDHLHAFDAWVEHARETGSKPKLSWDMTTPSPVRIGAGCWLGIGVVVLPGVTIGDGCAIGANSVVTNDVEDYTVAAGVPARAIRRVGD